MLIFLASYLSNSEKFKSLKDVGGAIHLSHSKSSKYLEEGYQPRNTTSIISKWDLGKRNNHVGWSLSKSFHYIIPILYTYILVLFRKKMLMFDEIFQRKASKICQYKNSFIFYEVFQFLLISALVYAINENICLIHLLYSTLLLKDEYKI